MRTDRRMKTVAEYRSYADQCRKLAARATTQPEDKEALQYIARQWDLVANERETIHSGVDSST
jgi:hypothetical protein